MHSFMAIAIVARFILLTVHSMGAIASAPGRSSPETNNLGRTPTAKRLLRRTFMYRSLIVAFARSDGTHQLLAIAGYMVQSKNAYTVEWS
jgi:hypothetical protein